MCDAAVDDLLETLKLNPNWLQISQNTTKMIKNFLLLCTQMKIYSTFMKCLVML